MIGRAEEMQVVHGLIVGGVIERYQVLMDETQLNSADEPAWRIVDLDAFAIVAAFFAPTNRGTAHERCLAFAARLNAGLPEDDEEDPDGP